MLYILIAILMFGVLIALHEFGHFAAAKLCGVKVNEFSIGMGPRLFHGTKGETEYSLRLLPIGGFCAMEGEEEGSSTDPRAFPNRPWYQRLIILLAGVFMNFLTGLIITLCIFSRYSAFPMADVTAIPEGFPTHSGPALQVGDRLTKVDGHAIYFYSNALMFLERSEGDRIDLEVERNGEKVVMKDYPLTLVPQADGSQRRMLGVVLGGLEEAKGLNRLKYAWWEVVDDVRLVWYSLGELVRGAVGLRDMSGPVGIVDMVGQVGQAGAAAAEEAGESALLGAMEGILSFGAFISINLAVMNLLPIPALDGGQILFMGVNGVYTAFTKKKMDPKYLGWVSVAGFACLMFFMLAVTVSDILKQFGV